MTPRESAPPRPGGLAPAPGGLELRHLRAFVVTAQERHFGRAASRLHLSQPALSRQIATLERLVGCTLLQRSTHHVEVTPAGVVLLDHARTIVADVEQAVTASRSAARADEGSAARWLEPLAAAVASGVGLDELRAAYEGLLASLPLPADVAARPVRLGGVPCLVVGTGRRRARLLHLHGGGYVMGSAYGYRSLAGAIAAAADVDVVVPDYRLAPEHPYPAALEDVLAVYRALVVEDPDELVVTGDSAGAGLAVTLLLTVRGLGLPLPGRSALLSPWIDPSPSRHHRVGDHSGWVHGFAARHTHVVDLDTTVNPLTADLSALPPTLVQAGALDPTADQARDLARRLRAHRRRVELETYPVGTHAFHHLWSFMPDAASAIERVGRFVTGDPAEEPLVG